MDPAPAVPVSTAPSRPTVGGALGRLGLVALLNIPLAVAIEGFLLAWIPPGTGWLGWSAAGVAAIATATSLCAVAWLLAAPATALLRKRVPCLVVGVLIFAVMQVLLYGDTVIYGLFRTHYNKMVWLTLTTPGAGDSLRIGTGTVVSGLIAIAIVLACELAIGWFAWRLVVSRAVRRLAIASAVSAVVLVLADKVIYAVGDLRSHVEITRVAQYFPLYQRMTIRRWAAKRGWAAPNAAAEVTTASGGALAYPKADVPFPVQPRPLNVVLIALEGARFDMLDPEIMPAVHAFGARHTTCLQHYSGGNATRFGIFSLLYGIHATYWQQVLVERRGPFLIQALERLGYAIDITSCTDLNFPEFRQTAFVDVLDRIHDTWPPGPRVDRDRLMTDRVVDLIATSNEPFFSFSFYDASHSSYLYPPEFAKFTPTQTDADVDFVTLAHAGSVDRLLPLFNRYRNSLGYVDAQIARVIAALEARGILDRTVVIITGDHGEEFGESGHFTHNSAFNRWQVQPLMVAHVPGLAPGVINTPTSHIDVPVTILAAIGFTAPFGDWTQGLPLGTATTRDHVLAVSWNAAALVAADGCMVFGTETYRPTIDLFDADYRPASDSDAALRRWRPLLPELARQLREYSR